MRKYIEVLPPHPHNRVKSLLSLDDSTSKGYIYFAKGKLNVKPPIDKTQLLKDLDFKPRVKTIFRVLRIHSIADLLKYSKNDLLKIRTFGVTFLKDVNRELKRHGIYKYDL